MIMIDNLKSGLQSWYTFDQYKQAKQKSELIFIVSQPTKVVIVVEDDDVVIVVVVDHRDLP